MNPPKVKQIPHKVVKHGDTRIDQYYWLRDNKDPEVLEYIRAENEYTEHVMNDTKVLQKRIFDEIVSKVKESDESLPYLSNGYYYFYKELKGKNYKVHFRKRILDSAEEELLLDENLIAEKEKYCSIVYSVSPNNRILCYQKDIHGDHYYTTYFKDLLTGEMLLDVLQNTGEMVWFNDSKNVYYTLNEEENIGKEVYRHTLGTKQKDDHRVFHEADSGKYVDIMKSKSNKYIFLQAGNINSNETYFIDANEPDGELKLFAQRKDDLLYVIEHNGDNFFVHTNKDAKNWRVMVTPVDNTSMENWIEFIPEKEGVKIEEFEIFREYMVLKEKDYGLTKLRIVKLNDMKSHYVEFPEEVYMAYMVNNYEFDSDFVRYTYSSFVTPQTIFDHFFETGETILRKQKEVPEFNSSDYITERHFAPSGDGKQIPISLVYKKGMKKDSKNLLYLDAYGSYGFSFNVYFAPWVYSILDRGFVYAIAHVRGGGELGESWYEDGKMLKKKNTFRDYISCAEYLISRGFTSSNKIAAHGTSAGGTLMGAVANMRPELFKCILADVPAVDTLNDMIDGGVHNAPYHFEENGNPDIEEQYFYLKSYTPYENIAVQAYPNILIVTGFHDNNVKYWGPVKYAAKLRDHKTDNNFLILKTDMESAHSGPSGRYEYFKQIAFEYAFVLKCFDIKN